MNHNNCICEPHTARPKTVSFRPLSVQQDCDVNDLPKKNNTSGRSCFDLLKKTACALIQSVPIHCPCTTTNNIMCEPQDDCEEVKRPGVQMMHQEECYDDHEGRGPGGPRNGGMSKTNSERQRRREQEQRMGKTRYKECKRRSKMLYQNYKQKEKIRKKTEKQFFQQCLKNEKAQLKEAKKRYKVMKDCAQQTRKTNNKKEKTKLKRFKEKLNRRCDDLKNAGVRGTSDNEEDIPFQDPMTLTNSALGGGGARQAMECPTHPCFLGGLCSRNISSVGEGKQC